MIRFVDLDNESRWALVAAVPVLAAVPVWGRRARFGRCACFGRRACLAAVPILAAVPALAAVPFGRWARINAMIKWPWFNPYHIIHIEMHILKIIVSEDYCYYEILTVECREIWIIFDIIFWV